jgi:hypothetical protein
MRQTVTIAGRGSSHKARDGSRPVDPMADHLLHTRGGQCGVPDLGQAGKSRAS